MRALRSVSLVVRRPAVANLCPTPALRATTYREPLSGRSRRQSPPMTCRAIARLFALSSARMRARALDPGSYTERRAGRVGDARPKRLGPLALALSRVGADLLIRARQQMSCERLTDSGTAVITPLYEIQYE